tara:strand:+ start:930 stop:1211 length:282 start_codon:yes stop_codon:yes gene_type:complete
MNELPTAEEMELLARITTMMETDKITRYDKPTKKTSKDTEKPYIKAAIPPPPRPIRHPYWTAQTIIGTLVAVHAALSVGMLILIYFLIQTGQY